jgi:RNA polymerase sigma factor (sigma-70 family)
MDFAAFFRAESERLVRFCWLLTLDRDEAADLAQEAMEQAYRQWDHLGGPGENPAGWIRTVAVNLSTSRWRRIRRLKDRLPRLVTSSTSRSAALDDPDLAAALGGLAPRQRQIVALRYWDDLTLRDCADAMGVSLGTAKQHLARAHRHLAATLDPSMLEELTL